MTTIAERKAALLERLEELDARIHHIEEELDEPVSKDWEDRSVEREEDEVLETMGVTSQVEIRMIQAALERIEADEYGFCVKCGAEILAARLDVLPYTPFCKNCAV